MKGLEVTSEWIARSESTAGAKQIHVTFDKFGDSIQGGASGTVEVPFLIPDVSAGFMMESGQKFTVASAPDITEKQDSEKTGKTDTETIGKTVSVGIVEKVEPVKEKHDGNPYMQGFVFGILFWVVICLCCFYPMRIRRQEKI